MKTKLLFILNTLFFSLQLYSQDYNPILKKGKFWDVYEVNRSSQNPCYINSISRDQIGKDTIIMDKTYRKIKRYPVVATRSGYYNCLEAPYKIDTTNYNFSEYYFREDITEKKVYRLRIENNEKIEEIYYDFSLKVGDTLDYNIFLNKEFSIVQEIEQDSNGNKKFIFDSSGDGTIGGYFYTEGLGGKFGFFHRTNYDWMNVYPNLNCQGDYMLENSCSVTLNTNDFFVKKFKLYPNPVKNILRIENNIELNLKIYSVTGNLLKTTNSKSDFEIDVSSFKSGIYFLEISNSRRKQIIKFLKI